MTDWFARARQLAEDTVKVNTDLARHWAKRSLDDAEWSVDTVTADLIEAWEYLTPLTGRALDLSLDLLQQRPRHTPTNDPSERSEQGPESSRGDGDLAAQGERGKPDQESAGSGPGKLTGQREQEHGHPDLQGGRDERRDLA
jgi:hypothetical protein